MDDLPIAELMRRLSLAVMAHAAFELHDDMTMVLIEHRSLLVAGESETVLSTPPG